MNAARGGELVAFSLVFVLGAVFAQPGAFGQVVQLPTIRTFSYSGTVEVPDRGSTSLGGNAAATRLWQRRGFAGPGHSLGRTPAVGSAVAHATIINLQAMDRQIRGAGDAHVSGNKSKRSTAEIDEGKSLVRYARRMRAAGNDSLAQMAYRLALKKLDPKLRKLAFEEFQRHYRRAATISSTSR